MLREGSLNDQEIEIQVADTGMGGLPTFDVPGMPGAQMDAQPERHFRQGRRAGPRPGAWRCRRGYEVLMAEESPSSWTRKGRFGSHRARRSRTASSSWTRSTRSPRRTEGRGGADVSREGVQRDLLPLVEGTTVATKHGTVKTDHILFIAAGAFHIAKPSDLMPELQGRFPDPGRAEALTRGGFPPHPHRAGSPLTKQYKALLKTEGVELDFADDAIDELASMAYEVNTRWRTSAPGGCTPSWNACWRKSASTPATGAGRAS